ncbi:MAG TPA: RnfABCDGE type electron transport complex subunit B [Patescibacteria group bacterium]|nr:RnfABCDGE type electron transport complex subunit B [Patescibacteria group bacterium]
MNQIFIISVGAMGAIGVFFGAFLAYSSKKFAIETDDRIIKIEKALPGANCGACGFPGCSAYAEAIINQGVSIGLCSVGGQTVATEIGKITGASSEENMIIKVANVMCQGGANCMNSFEYVGIKDCHAANLLHKGNKSCKYGCLGLGSCIKVCPFNAITINKLGVAEIDSSRCTGCGICIKECPKDIIEPVPEAGAVHVLCKNTEPGKVVKPKCNTGCIACKLCERVCESKAIRVEGNLASINYDLCTGCMACVDKCPVKTIKGIASETQKKQSCCG